MQVPVHFELRRELHLDAERIDAEVEFDVGEFGLEILPQVEVELQRRRREHVGKFALAVEEQDPDVVDGDLVGVVTIVRYDNVVRAILQQVDAVGTQHVEQRLLEQADQAVEVQVVLADRVRQGFQQVVAEVADDVGGRVVGQQVADKRQVDAEHLPVQRVLDGLEHAIQAVDHHGRIAQQREQARQLEVVEEIDADGRRRRETEGIVRLRIVDVLDTDLLDRTRRARRPDQVHADDQRRARRKQPLRVAAERHGEYPVVAVDTLGNVADHRNRVPVVVRNAQQTDDRLEIGRGDVVREEPRHGREVDGDAVVFLALRVVVEDLERIERSDDEIVVTGHPVAVELIDRDPVAFGADEQRQHGGTRGVYLDTAAGCRIQLERQEVRDAGDVAARDLVTIGFEQARTRHRRSRSSRSHPLRWRRHRA